MAEEHGFEAQEGHRLCANNCGFFGSPATHNYCSKCYSDIYAKEEQAKSAKSAVENSLFGTSSSSSSSAAAAAAAEVRSVVAPVPTAVLPEAAGEEAGARPRRCAACPKKVGLMGFRCRCGVTFCGAHRYPEQHRCGFDFKAAGREAIAKANPLVKGVKLEKI
ncbi:hypothetical protein RJ639_035256 [Escallonia herrerae]|uniref:Uncharacterized protein n=1 Tax=Escallonia herrerae TaxID=1293975 RepID=A0AA88WUU7_9ASTE|nr:hypothetical protein RJ639_035256 [Escallonia herrerae]